MEANDRSIPELVAEARLRLRQAGIPEREAGLDARLLAQHVLGWDATRFLTTGNGIAPEGFAARYGQAVNRRVAREPLAYVTGTKEFWNLSFEVSPAVLIPRPETELLVEAALEHFPDTNAALRVADVGTGSGCVAIALASERPKAHIVATDISERALVVARRNAARCGLSARIDFLVSDLLAKADGEFDLILANPPYVRKGDRPALQPEVRDFEPHAALFGGADGLEIIRRLLDEAARKLRPRGLLMFEFGAGQEEGVDPLIVQCSGLTLMGTRADLQGITRVAIATRQAG